MDNNELTLNQSIALIGRFVIHRKYWILGGLIAGILIGLGLNQLPKQYVSKFTIESKSVNPDLFIQLIRSASEALDEDQYEAIAEQCDCEVSVVKGWNNISVNVPEAIGDEGFNQLEIRLNTSAPEDVVKSEACIMNLLRNNPLVKAEQEAFVKVRESALTQVLAEIKELNNLQTAYKNILEQRPELPMGIYSNGAHGEMMLLIKYQMELEEALMLTDILYPITRASPPSRPTFGIVKALTIGALVGFVLGLSLALLNEILFIIRNAIKIDRQEEKKQP